MGRLRMLRKTGLENGLLGTCILKKYSRPLQKSGMIKLQKQRRGKICSAVFMNLCYNSVKENISEYYSAADMEIIQRNVNVF